MRKRVVIESPFRGRHKAEEARNVAYLHRAMRHSIGLGEAPYASHELYTRALADSDPTEREAGIDAGLSWGRAAELVAVYLDLGCSPGMLLGVRAHRDRGTLVEARWLSGPVPYLRDGSIVDILERGMYPYVPMLGGSRECHACGDAFADGDQSIGQFCSAGCMERARRLLVWAEAHGVRSGAT